MSCRQIGVTRGGGETQLQGGGVGTGHAAGIDRSFVSVSINFQIERQLYSNAHVAKTIATDVHRRTHIGSFALDI